MSEPKSANIEKPAVRARQAQSGMGVRYVLAISTFAAAAIMGLIYVLFFMS
jgi:hypothetical protein